MRRLILVLLFCFSGFLTLNAKTIIQEATYIMGDDDSKASARNKAILKAKRDSIEQAGVFVSSYSEFSNGKLNDTIESFAGSVMKVTILNEKFSYPNYRVKIKSKIDIKLLNKKLKQFSQSGANVDDQISSSLNEIENYNKRLNQLIKDRNKKKELKNLQEKKKRLIKKVNNLANNKAIDLNIIKNRNYGYITVTSNVKDAEIYIDGKYVGYAPIKRFKVPSEKDIELKAVADKRYYPDDKIETINIKRLTTPSFEMNIIKGKAEIFFIGGNGSLFINKQYIKELTNNNRVAKIDSGNNIEIAIVKKNKIAIIKRNFNSNNLYELEYILKINNIASEYTSLLIWIDKNENLMWQDNKEANTIIKSWYRSNDYCLNLSLAGYTDWYLPNLNQLKRLYPKQNYLEYVATYYWSSTENTRRIDRANSILFGNSFGSGGTYNHHRKTNSKYIRCVRDIK